MNEVPQNELFKLKGFLEEIVKEQNARLTGAEAIVKLDRAYTGKYSKCFVDNVNDPNHILILSHYPGLTCGGFICVITLIYSRKEKRTKEASDEMLKKAENYAREHDCEEITGGSWTYKGSKSSNSLWESKGYEPQGTIYIKLL